MVPTKYKPNYKLSDESMCKIIIKDKNDERIGQICCVEIIDEIDENGNKINMCKKHHDKYKNTMNINKKDTIIRKLTEENKINELENQ